MKKLLLPLALSTGLALAAPTADVTPDKPLIVEGPIVVDAGDVEGYMLKIPPEHRADFRTDYDRVAGVADGIFVQRSFAAKARAEGLDRDPIVQRRMRQAAEAVLADVYVEKLQSAPIKINLDEIALEDYKAEPAKFMTPDLVAVQHILIDLKGRTRDMALQRAREVYELAKSGKQDFLDLVARYSDAQDKKRNGGDLGYSSPRSFVEPVSAAIEKMSVKGEIAGPIESEYGYHILKFVDRKKPERIPFESVKRKLVEVERDKLRKQRLDDAVQAIRNSPTVVTNRGNVQALVIPIDPDVIKRAIERQNETK